ncbi:MAG: cyclic pyranopterin monophosphate synthase MoaC [Schaedlerella sp.]|nr:cyclic pyranopterin monophosphate synthase MoaC [Schaedlerella sp.]
MAVTVDIQKDLGGFNLNIQFKSSAKRIGILGASGCGKSMTLKSIAGIETPTTGKICIGERVLYDSSKKINIKAQKRNVGYLFQNYALFPTMTVAKNIEAGLKRKKAENQKRVKEMLKKFQLEEFADRLPGQLSGGQQQRVALARIMAYEPEMILLDEPFSALDVYLKDRLQQELMEMLSDYEGIVIMVSHSRDEVYRFSEELMIIENGFVAEHGKTKEIFANPGTKETAKLLGYKKFSDKNNIFEKSKEERGTQMELTHFDKDGKAYMVDVTEKAVTHRTAVAEGKIKVNEAVYRAIEEGTIGKGDVLGVARVAGIMGLKRTSEFIPMCHTLLITHSKIEFEMKPEELSVYCRCTVTCDGKTGVEMEALTGVSVALLTIYDMCKALDKCMEIGDVYLCRKTGGKSGEIVNEKHKNVVPKTEK